MTAVQSRLRAQCSVPVSGLCPVGHDITFAHRRLDCHRPVRYARRRVCRYITGLTGRCLCFHRSRPLCGVQICRTQLGRQAPGNLKGRATGRRSRTRALASSSAPGPTAHPSSSSPFVVSARYSSPSCGRGLGSDHYARVVGRWATVFGRSRKVRLRSIPSPACEVMFHSRRLLGTDTHPTGRRSPAAALALATRSLISSNVRHLRQHRSLGLERVPEIRAQRVGRPLVLQELEPKRSSDAALPIPHEPWPFILSNLLPQASRTRRQRGATAPGMGHIGLMGFSRGYVRPAEGRLNIPRASPQNYIASSICLQAPQAGEKKCKVRGVQLDVSAS